MNSNEDVAKWHKRSSGLPRLKAMIETATSELGITVHLSELNKDPMLLGVKNGAIDLKTGKLRSPRHTDFITNCVDTHYDQSAKCPVFRNFLSEIFSDSQEMTSYIQRIMGYSLTGRTDEQCLFLLYGLVANGKSTLIRLFSDLLGTYARAVSPETFLAKRGNSIPNDIARLAGARFVHTVELEDGRRFAESIVKQMTGGDTITARFLHKEYFDFAPQFKLLIATNHKPIIRGSDYAIWRRIRLIPFEVIFPPEKQNRRLPEKLHAELPGILNWAIEGCLEWQSDGLNDPKSVLAATDEYRDEQDILQVWLAARCIIVDRGEEKASDLFNDFRSWAKENNEWEMGTRRFSQMLIEKGFERHVKNLGNFYRGVQLKQTYVRSERKRLSE